MIPRKIHQVFWSFTGKELNDIPKFKEYTTKTQQFANHYGYEYKLWSLKDCEEFLIESLLIFCQINGHTYTVIRTKLNKFSCRCNRFWCR